VLAGAGLTIAATWAGIEAGDLPAYLFGVPVLAALPSWLAWRSGDRHVRALRRAAAREHVLAELGNALLTAADAAQVHRLAARAAAGLLAGCPAARASVIAAEGEHAISDGRVSAEVLPSGLLARLRKGEVITDRALLLLPLVSGDRFFGVLRVSAADLPGDLRKPLLTLGAQVALALDNLTLAAELRQRAGFDTLTGLANRTLLRERLDAALARSRRSGRPVAALVVDLNGFKQINDAYGHDVGDRVLAEVAERLRLSVRAEDVVGRLGGDEFVVFAEDLHTAMDAIGIAERIVANLDRPITVGRGPLRVSASIGVALSRAGTQEHDGLLKLAGVAMGTAKRRGGGYHLEGAVRVG
jgi:diguanylate cyclase (GGDEF)-like protein